MSETWSAGLPAPDDGAPLQDASADPALPIGAVEEVRVSDPLGMAAGTLRVPGWELLLSRRREVRTAAQVGLLILALIVAAYFARSVILPVVIALFLYMILLPVVRRMRRLGIPEQAGAALLVFAGAGITGLAVWQLWGPATQWIESFPEVLTRLEEEIRGMRGSMAKVSDAAERVAEIASGSDGMTQRVEIKSAPLQSVVLGFTASFAAMAFAVIALLYFMLATGERFMRRLARLMPKAGSNPRTLGLVSQIEANVSRYLGTVTLINLCLGASVAGVMWLLDMPNPFLWGALAAIANFVPYIGSSVLTVVLFLAALVSFDDGARVLLPPLAFIALSALEGTFVTPGILGRHLRLEPVVIIASLLFWGWMWGIPGMLLAVPMLVVAKIACDRLPALAPLGQLIGR